MSIIDMERKGLKNTNVTDPKNCPPLGTDSLRRGDHDGFSRVYLAYAEGLVAFLTTMLGSRDEAEEMTQDIFVRLWESKDAIDPDKNIKSYIFTFARRMAIDRLRHRKVRDKYISYIGYSQNGAEVSPDQMMISRENELALQAAIDSMPPKQKEVFIMSLQDGMTDDELAERFSISKRTVQVHLYNATKYIRQVLNGA